jgi:uncharacterized membrane protein YidH (DUF202 family)
MSHEGPGSASAVALSLGNERTHLAWQRTAISWAGAGAVVTRYFAADGFFRLPTIIGTLMLLVGALVWLDGSRRYHRAARAIHSGSSLPSPLRSIQAVWIATMIVAITTVVVELFT